MDTGFRTPLLDMFRRGTVDPDIRLLAARGALAPRAHEQLALLVLLVSDEVPEIARAAETTIENIPRDALTAFLSRSDAPSELVTFFQARGIEPTIGDALVGDGPLVDTSDTAPVDAIATEAPANVEASATIEPAATTDAPGGDASADAETPDADDDLSIVQKIAGLNVAGRLSLAMKGSREERAILIRDPNRIVCAAVLSSPKLTETEVESIAKMANVSEDVLRIIANTRAWMKNYQVVVGLTKNPKTPVAISMNMLSRLLERDLKKLSTDKNVPDVLRVTARKKLVLDK